MIEFDHFIYLDVHRTGSTHTIDMLRRVSESKEIRLRRHGAVTSYGFLVRPGKRLVFATVRNPWSWYVSLWGHGADGRSAIRRHMRRKLSPGEICSFYDTREPAAAFRRWLTAVHDPAFINKHLAEGYPRSNLAPLIGLYTYRFQRVTTRYPRLFLRRWWIRNASDIVSFHHKHKTYQLCLRTETLTNDLAKLIEDQRDRCKFKSDALQVLRERSHKKRNASTPLLPHYRDYYDEKTAKLVAERDRFFLDEFGYQF